MSAFLARQSLADQSAMPNICPEGTYYNWLPDFQNQNDDGNYSSQQTTTTMTINSDTVTSQLKTSSSYDYECVSCFDITEHCRLCSNDTCHQCNDGYKLSKNVCLSSFPVWGIIVLAFGATVVVVLTIIGVIYVLRWKKTDLLDLLSSCNCRSVVWCHSCCCCAEGFAPPMMPVPVELDSSLRGNKTLSARNKNRAKTTSGGDPNIRYTNEPANIKLTTSPRVESYHYGELDTNKDSEIIYSNSSAFENRAPVRSIEEGRENKEFGDDDETYYNNDAFHVSSSSLYAPDDHEVYMNSEEVQPKPKTAGRAPPPSVKAKPNSKTSGSDSHSSNVKTKPKVILQGFPPEPETQEIYCNTNEEQLKKEEEEEEELAEGEDYVNSADIKKNLAFSRRT